MNEKDKKSKKWPDQTDISIKTLVDTAKDIASSNPEYGHALRAVASRGLGYAGLGDSGEKQKLEMKESILEQLKRFEKAQEGGGRKLLEIIPETLRELITEKDLEDLGIK